MAHLAENVPEPRVLLVEGQNDKHVVLQLCNCRPAIQDFLIRDRDNVEQLLESVGGELNSPGLLALGILVDADTNPAARWDAVKYRLLEEGIRDLDQPNTNGVVVTTEGKPRVGIWLMPDNELSGELENFIEEMIPAGDPVWPLAQNYIAQIPPEDRKFTENKELRAKIHAWLATREDPRQMGLAIRTRDLEVDGALCRNFLAWLTNLFGENPLLPT